MTNQSLDGRMQFNYNNSLLSEILSTNRNGSSKANHIRGYESVGELLRVYHVSCRDTKAKISKIILYTDGQKKGFVLITELVKLPHVCVYISVSRKCIKYQVQCDKMQLVNNLHAIIYNWRRCLLSSDLLTISLS